MGLVHYIYITLLHNQSALRQRQMASGTIQKPVSMSFITAKEQLGLTYPTTLASIVQAMPTNSILQIIVDNVLTTEEMPNSTITWGILVINKYNNTRWVAKWYSQYASNNQYFEYAKSGIIGESTTLCSWKTIHAGV